MEKEKFQQKALKQTKQKKSKSAEFLMVKEEKAAIEGIENPAFNISSTDLSAYQPSKEKVTTHDKPDSTLAAHQQKLRLQAHAEPRGNEYSRNYFDLLMDEEINPRQCGMEVSEEDPVKFDEQILYGKLMKLLDEENIMLDLQESVASEDFPDSVMPVSSSKAHDLHRELEDEEIPSYIEQFERDVQDDIILLGSFSLEQVRVKNLAAVLTGLWKVAGRVDLIPLTRRLPALLEQSQDRSQLSALPGKSSVVIHWVGERKISDSVCGGGREMGPGPAPGTPGERKPKAVQEQEDLVPTNRGEVVKAELPMTKLPCGQLEGTPVEDTGTRNALDYSVGSLNGADAQVNLECSSLFPNCCRVGSQLLKAEGNESEEEMAASFGNHAVLNAGLNVATGPCKKVDCSKTPQLIEIHVKCLRGVKDKVPKGHYTLKVSVLSRLGGGLLEWPKMKEQPQARTTLPVSHDGNFYNTEIYFEQSIQTVLPPTKAVKPGMVLLFELFLLRGTHTWIDREVGWGAFPVCDNNFNTLEGKFKCPFLRGHYDSKIDRFKKIENLISQDLDHWLCNLYFQIIKLPQDSDEQSKCGMHLNLPPEHVMYSSPAEKNGVSENVEQPGLQGDGFKLSCFYPGFHWGNP
ncbi:uncharacterized protein LOC130593815 [Pezoporus wallicus]|uniref:uncharacterized protein LOC130593815 n=1 Tax=Pezoporus wallicus TaxID=35540 RepID=UPI00254A9F9B|nr:uncharacterized protein LOC130593815 [Pezoporus wallicus]